LYSILYITIYIYSMHLFFVKGKNRYAELFWDKERNCGRRIYLSTKVYHLGAYSGYYIWIGFYLSLFFSKKREESV